jgi:uncharacterized protein (DUF305 family)
MNTLIKAACCAASITLASAGALAHSGAHDLKQDMKPAMEKGHEKMMSMPMSGKPDADFAAMMREHHKSGVEMAQWQLEHGTDPKMKAMARKIAASQKKEIADFDKWLASHGEKGEKSAKTEKDAKPAAAK